MATVYLARRRESAASTRLVAIKVMHHDLALDSHYLDMFIDEGRILARLSHPNIVETIETGVSGNNSFIVMDLLLGRTAADVCDERERRGERIPYALAAWIGARVADALHHAHEATDGDGTRLEVVHRDANPSNIILTYDGAVKLIDFGLAKATRRRARSAQGIVKGKVAYLSPEQIHQRAVDHRSDLYTLGSAIWEMTTGRRLWKRGNDVETLEAIREGKVPDPTSFIEGYPEELWAIVWESLLPLSDDRHADAATLSRDLDAFAAHAVGAERSGRMPDQLAELMEATFPGERALRENWRDVRLRA
jgi:eukaryotic-like serine/threonine-protein kinase